MLEEYDVAFHLMDGSVKLFCLCSDAEKIVALQIAHTELIEECQALAAQVAALTKKAVNDSRS